MKKYLILILIFSCIYCKTNNEQPINENKTIQNLKPEKPYKSNLQIKKSSFNDTALLKQKDSIQKQNCGESELYVFVIETDSNGIDIRNKPDGEIINKLIHDENNMGYIITLIEAINGWFKISEIEGLDFDVPKLKNEAWIHGSFVAVSTRNYGNQELELLDKPNSKKVISKIRNVEWMLKINDLCGDWVQVNYQNQLGWINKKWLCGNPVTTCP
jgi:SH3-like domain-containing protein